MEEAPFLGHLSLTHWRPAVARVLHFVPLVAILKSTAPSFSCSDMVISVYFASSFCLFTLNFLLLVIKEICSRLQPFCKQTESPSYPSNKGGSLSLTIVQFKHKQYKSSWLYLTCFSFMIGHFCMNVFLLLSTSILGLVFCNYVFLLWGISSITNICCLCVVLVAAEMPVVVDLFNIIH